VCWNSGTGRSPAVRNWPAMQAYWSRVLGWSLWCFRPGPGWLPHAWSAPAAFVFAFAAEQCVVAWFRKPWGKEKEGGLVVTSVSRTNHSTYWEPDHCYGPGQVQKWPEPHSPVEFSCAFPDAFRSAAWWRNSYCKHRNSKAFRWPAACESCREINGSVLRNEGYVTQ